MRGVGRVSECGGGDRIIARAYCRFRTFIGPQAVMILSQTSIGFGAWEAVASRKVGGERGGTASSDLDPGIKRRVLVAAP